MCVVVHAVLHARPLRCAQLVVPFTQDPGLVALTIFIAEDNKLALDSLAELLVSIADVEIVGSANSEMSAADWLVSQQRTWDVLITDLLLLPGGSGFGLIRHAKSFNAFTRVVVFSDFVTPAVAERCIALGADAVFKKSDLAQLLDYVRGLAGETKAG
jgi:two-component system, OmpR family, response regulator